VFSISAPQTLKFAAERHLGTLVPLLWLELQLKKFDFLGDLCAGDMFFSVFAGRVS
jgi:hypothetical protein